MKILNSYKSLGWVALTLATLPAFAQKNRAKGNEVVEVIEPLKNWSIDTLLRPIPANRGLFTDYVDKQLKTMDVRDGKVDQRVTVSDTLASRIMTQNVLLAAQLLQIRIENIETDHQTKILYHRNVERLLKQLNAKNFEDIDLMYARRIVPNLEGIIIARETGTVKDFVRQNANIYTIDNADLLNGYPNEKSYVYETVGKATPELLIDRLSEFYNEPYADVVVAAAAEVMPGAILKYALSTSKLGSVVRRNQDPLVQTISRIASESSQPWMVLPFLSQINSGALTIRAADALTQNEDAYLKALVDLKTSNVTLGEASIDQELNLRSLKYVRLVNELHNSPAPVRFKSLTTFRPQDLYFMMIGGQQELYTSSFVWMFNRMLEQMKPETGDQLLTKVNNYHFRTFLRMCAGYNTLTPFFSTMDEAAKTKILTAFVSNLEEGKFDDLEGAVDLADAYASIQDPKMTEFIRAEVQSNYLRVQKLSNKEKQEKGTIVYGLLSTIFASADNPEAMNTELSAFIPPIMFVPNATLKAEDGRVYEVSYFYGDADGKGAYANYINSFKGKTGWNVTHNNYWSTITYAGKNPITIFANKPLPEETGQDEEAQKQMMAYLEDSNIHPTIFIHRGHSYYLPTSLSYLTASAKIVMLGSCGGYHNLATVLSSSPDAHIISSKQVGTLNINMHIIQEIDKRVVDGNDVNWIELWTVLNDKFSKTSAAQKDMFSDYIPPNRNLGVIFIKAYKKMAASLDA